MSRKYGLENERQSTEIGLKTEVQTGSVTGDITTFRTGLRTSTRESSQAKGSRHTIGRPIPDPLVGLVRWKEVLIFVGGVMISMIGFHWLAGVMQGFVDKMALG